MEHNFKRRKTRSFFVGGVGIGAPHKISIQSMTNTDTHDMEATFRQVTSLAACGCDVVRIALPDIEAAKTVSYIKERNDKIPLVADIHYDYKIALEALSRGIDKIRINPGNIGDRDRVLAVVRGCREKNIPIRIGVNSGSLEKGILAKYGDATAEALAESALSHARILEELDFSDVAISVKASSVEKMLLANRILAEKTDYPLHLGVTEAGGGRRALIKSSIGIGALLSEGIGDTIRVSLTDKPEEEVVLAREILSSLGLSDKGGMDIVSCPTCGRTKINLIDLVSEFERRAGEEGLLDMNIKVSLMGCAVNGPGEARDADVGIAGGIGEGLLFRRGEIIKKVKEDKLVDELIREIKTIRESEG